MSNDQLVMNGSFHNLTTKCWVALDLKTLFVCSATLAKDRLGMRRKRNGDVFGRRKGSKRRWRSRVTPKVDTESANDDITDHSQSFLKRVVMWSFQLLLTTLNSAKSILLPQTNIRVRLDLTQSELQDTKQELKALSEKVKQLEKRMAKATQSSTLPPLPPMAIPIPPPPPPPPPPVVKPLKRSFAITRRPKKIAEEKSTKPLCVTLDDILKVKLKKTEPSADKENKVPNKLPRITLDEITSVHLKTRADQCRVSGTTRKPSKSELLSRALRKTAIKRSPGGTPIAPKDKTRSTATGPTPDMERALQRKFRSIKTSPLVERLNFDNSF